MKYLMLLLFSFNLGAMQIPQGWGADFYESMSCIQEKIPVMKTKIEWQQAQKLYEKYVINELEISETPRIPKIFHQIWIGSPLPEKYKKFQESWKLHHPDWQYILWTDKEIAALGLENQDLYNASKNKGQKSDIARYEILYRFGGVYVDTDFECLKPFDIFNHALDFYTGSAYGPEFSVYVALIGCAAQHPIMKNCIDTLTIDYPYHKDPAINILFTTGPYHLTRHLKKHMASCKDRCVTFPVGYFYPWPNNHRHENSPEQIKKWFRPESWAVHHWESSWNEGKAPGALSFTVPKMFVWPQVPLKHEQRPGSYPYIAGDTFRKICDHIIDETMIPFDPAKMQEGDIIFLAGNYMAFFFNMVYPTIKKRFILVTHNSIHPAGAQYLKYLDDDKIIGWFGKNATGDHPKLHPLPLGIANIHWPHGNYEKIKELQQTNIIKDKFLYMNFDPNTNKERSEVEKIFADASYCYKASKKPFNEFLKDIAGSVFVISPEGSSVDCHRIWEVLMMGSIPVIKHSMLDKMLAELPVILIYDWHEVTLEFLLDQYQKMKGMTFSHEKMYAPYWIEKILAMKKQTQEKLNR